MVAPVSEPKDILSNPQLEARQFWTKLQQPQFHASLTVPGTFFRSSVFTAKADQPAPRVAEHNIEIYERELGLTRKEILALKQTGVI
jgi:crotonobetainyl-CoA:carnitine CoA-transferase CaiB-like acyl-CoA transferase